MKNLILITAYTPDSRRQKILRNFVESINKSKFDIMVCSHSIIPQDLFDAIDYLIYEKDNHLCFNFEEKFKFFFRNNNFIIHSTEPKKFNHFIAIMRSINSGMNYAKALGYKKVHYFEYDSLIKNDSELDENSILLDTYSAIYYKPSHLDYPNSPVSFNLEKISNSWFELGFDRFYKFLYDKTSTKLVEEYELILLNEGSNILEKFWDILPDKGLDVGLHQDLEKNKWIVPYYDSRTDNLFVFSWAESPDEINTNILIIVNDTTIYKQKLEIHGNWRIVDLGNVNSISNIKIIVNDVITKSYSFDSGNINEFISRNYIEYLNN